MHVICCRISSLSAITFTFAMSSSVRPSVVCNVRAPYSRCDMSCDEPVVLFRRMRESVINTYEHGVLSISEVNFIVCLFYSACTMT